MKITIPELSLVVLIGASGSGKSTFARKHFRPTEVLSSDFCRGLVSDDENDQSATDDAFDVLHYIAAKRLEAGRLTVVDATNVSPESRKPLVALARKYHVIPVAVVFHVPERLAHERNASRPDRDFGPHVVRRHVQQLRRSLSGLGREGFRHVFVIKSQEEEEADAVEIERQPLWNNRKHDHGPFDIIGDVHGCFDELVALLEKLGYSVAPVPAGDGTHPTCEVTPPEGRKAVFLGDLVDRGPNSLGVLPLVMGMVEQGAALCVPGNHDTKLVRALRGRNVQVAHGLAETLAQLEGESAVFREKVAEFLDGLVSHYVLDDGRLVVAHAGLKEEMQGRGSRAVRDFALYGETTGETDEFGLPVRYNWAAEYRGKAMVVYGHTPVPEAEWLNNTINIDTGCVFGGKLTALRYPERELVSVPALHTYYQPARPFLPQEEQAPALTTQQRHDEVLDLQDVVGKRYISTRLHGNVLVREENAIAALEVMSRFAANPRWLVYLPPTMSPTETTQVEGLLEHPAEAFAYYRHEGVPRVVCEKHMGSRAVVIVCRDEDAARRRFGVVGEGFGIVYTRTGRRFFNDAGLEAEFLSRVRSALDAGGTWEEFGTDWVCLDCELMPWSAKAQELLRGQYAAVGAASRAALSAVVSTLVQANERGADVGGLLETYAARAEIVDRYVDAYRRYCWPVESVDDLRLAPFHVLATEGKVHTDKDHVWHMDTLARICRAAGDPLLLTTPYRVVDTTDQASVDEGIAWWEELTGSGGEGMVVKPLDFVVRGRRGLVQPAVKCRGREYLRIIYGPEYTAPENLERLRSRGLGAKRSLALREFALGVEGLECFVRGEPLRRVHECAFGVLALESEPVDPRL
jgi:polynucleotide kinase-phosphatase